jgi:hypothetical protein
MFLANTAFPVHDMPMPDTQSSQPLQQIDQAEWQMLLTAIRGSLEQAHGPLLKGEALARALGYKNLAALRQAKKRNQVGVALFELPHRKGWHALTVEVADWLAMCRLQSCGKSEATAIKP